MENQLQQGVSRRGFIKGAVLGGLGALTMADRYAFAEALVGGKSPADVHGFGVPKGEVRLSGNENALGPSPRAIEAVAQHLFEINRYNFSRQLPALLNKFHGIEMKQVDPFDFRSMMRNSRVFLGAGSGAVLQAAGLASLSDGGEVVEAEPAYGQISRMGLFFKRAGHNVNVKRTPLTTDNRHDLEAMRKAITPATKIVVITNPNNPTGTIVSREEIEKFVDAVPENVLILIDEAYIHFVKDRNYKDATDLALSRPNVLVTRTFSKVYGLAGMRVGYGLTSPKVLGKLYLYGSGMGVNVLGSYAAEAALADWDHVRRCQKMVWEGREYFYKEFKALNLPYIPSETNFVLVNAKTDSKSLTGKLREKKVFVSDADRRWRIKNHLRVTVGTMEENEAFISALRAVLT